MARRGPNHAEWLRSVLKAERLRKGWTLESTATRIAKELDRSLTKQSLHDWEEGVNQPRVDAFAGWAKVLGLQLEVELVTPGDGAVSVRVPAHLADSCRALAMMPPADYQVIVDMISRLNRH